MNTMSIYDRICVSGTIVPADESALRSGLSDGVPFPLSYVRFIRKFGYGTTCERFLIYPPLGDFPDSFHEQSPGIKAALLTTLRPGDRAYDWQLQPDGSEELVERLVGFATGENGESLFWDVHGPAAAGEYPIYLTGRGMGIRYGGSSLEDFIARVADQFTVKQVLKFESSSRPLTFKAANSTHLDAWRRRAAGR